MARSLRSLGQTSERRFGEFAALLPPVRAKRQIALAQRPETGLQIMPSPEQTDPSKLKTRIAMRKWLIGIASLCLLGAIALLCWNPKAPASSEDPTNTTRASLQFSKPPTGDPKIKPPLKAPPQAKPKPAPKLPVKPAQKAPAPEKPAKIQEPERTNAARIATLSKRGGFVGQVVDQRADPVPGAKVIIRAGRSTLGALVTDKAGRFRWREPRTDSTEMIHVQASQLELRISRRAASVKGDASSLEPTLRLRLSAPHSGLMTDLGKIVIPALITVSGVVVDSAGRPLKGVNLELRPIQDGAGLPEAAISPQGILVVPDGSFVKAKKFWLTERFRASALNAKSSTDAKGQFRFARVPTGHFALGGFARRIRDFVTGLRLKQDVSALKIVIDPLRQLVLRVTDRAGRPISGARVTGYFPDDLCEDALTETIDFESLKPKSLWGNTDSKGRFSTGSYYRSRFARVRVSAPGFVAMPSERVPTQIDARQAAVIQLDRGVVRRGSVKCSCELAPKESPHELSVIWVSLLQLDPRGQPAEDSQIRIKLYLEEGEREGQFKIRAPKPGRYWLRIEEESHETLERQVVVGATETTLPPFTFEALTSLTVELDEERSVRSVNLTVEPRHGPTRSWSLSSRSIQDGVIRFERVARGSARVQILGNGSPRQRSLGFVDPTEIRDGSLKVKAVTTLAGALTGSVITSSKPARLASVKIFRRGFSQAVATVTCDAKGQFNAGWLIVGHYFLVAEGPGGRARSEPFQLGTKALELSPLALEMP